MTRLEWLQERQRGIGASDAASLIGVGFNDALAVYRSKIEPVKVEPIRGMLARGIALEPLVAERYAEEMGIELIPAELTRHPERPWQFATIDRLRADGRPVELKTCTGWGEEWGESGSADVPEKYAVQCQQQMGVVAADSCDLAALDVISWELRVYRLAFNRDFFEWITGVEARFMDEHIDPMIPPDQKWEAQFDPSKVIRLIEPGSRAEFGDDVSELIERRKAYGEIKKEAEAEYDRLGDQIKALMDGVEKGSAPGWNLSWVHCKETTFTTTRQAYRYVQARRAKA